MATLVVPPSKVCTLALGLLWLAFTLHAPAQITTAAPTPTVAPATPAPVHYTEITRRAYQYSDHTVTVVQVQAPNLPKAAPSAPPPGPSVEEQATEKRRASKAQESLTIGGTVYLGSGNKVISEFTWTTDDGKKYQGYSNIDLRLFNYLSVIETDTSVISWFTIIGATDGTPDATLHGAALKQLNGKGTKPDYVIEGNPDPKLIGAALDALDYLHATYQVNGNKLQADYQKRVADNEAQTKATASAPSPSPTIYYWPMPATKP